MGLIPRFSAKDISAQLGIVETKIKEDSINMLRYVGETFVKGARENLNIGDSFPQGDYTDRTGNLRSSIGYFVLDNGRVVFENLSGTPVGAAMAREAMYSADKSGLQLVGVAGMDYASYVESKGFNVITSQAGLAIVNLQSLLQKYRDAMNRKGAIVDFGTDLSGVTSTAFR
jgi:hypothetical protein